MTAPRYVSYLRVSTKAQGDSGLGLSAQREAVARHVQASGGILVAEFEEVESGKRADRPQLVAAMAHARITGTTLLIAKLDRLSRDAHFLLGLERANVAFQCCDNPHANRLTVGILALVADEERRTIAARTKAALGVVKATIAAQGKYTTKGGRTITRLGGAGAAHLQGLGNGRAVAAIRGRADAHAAQVGPVIAALHAEGVTSAKAVARCLNDRGVLAPRGGAWTATAVQRVLARTT